MISYDLACSFGFELRGNLPKFRRKSAPFDLLNRLRWSASRISEILILELKNRPKCLLQFLHFRTKEKILNKALSVILFCAFTLLAAMMALGTPTAAACEPLVMPSDNWTPTFPAKLVAEPNLRGSPFTKSVSTTTATEDYEPICEGDPGPHPGLPELLAYPGTLDFSCPWPKSRGNGCIQAMTNNYYADINAADITCRQAICDCIAQGGGDEAVQKCKDEALLRFDLTVGNLKDNFEKDAKNSCPCLFVP